ncbi:MAG: trypsin-like peptidase domain-containing protein [Planctomycetes bacterium]|nr:trypsin-like peptidase domain-containing protein [Planctomycetota bacterium]
MRTGARAAAVPWLLGVLLATLPAQGIIAPTLLSAPAVDEATAALRASGAAGVVFGKADAVVKIVVEVTAGGTPFELQGPRTGLVVHPAGYVVTWSTAVGGADGASLFVQRAGQPDARLPAKVVANDAATGLALLQVASDGPLVAFELAGGVGNGEPAVVIANPEGKELIVFAGVTTPAQAGVVHRGRALAPTGLLLTDARIDLRCEGGALVGARGELLGICSAEHVRRETSEPTLAELKSKNFGFALPAAAIRSAFAQQLGEQAKPAVATPSATAVALAKAGRSVVGVWGGDGTVPTLGDEDPFGERRREGLGSGVVLSRSGLVATNAHLVPGEQATVTLTDGRTVSARLLKRRTAANLALLRCELPSGIELEPIACGDGTDLILGETVLGIGNPTGRAPGVTIGVLSAVRQRGVLQADPDLGNQNGGGALVDLTGRLLAIVDGGRVDRVDRAFAMEGSEAKTETNLNLCVGVEALRQAFAEEIEEHAAATESIRTPLVVTAAERALRTTKVAAAVQKSAAAMLNVYVSRVTTPVSADDNPFADRKEVRTEGESLGSGVIVTASGLAITNWHVVDAATEPDGQERQDHVVQVRRFDGRSFDVRVLAISREDDLALLQLILPEGETVQPVELGDSDALLPGETVIAIGNPHGQSNTITAGVVTAKEQAIRVKGRWAELQHLIETDAAINGGNSGGALIDLAGRLVGINSAGSRGSESRGYAIAIDHVRRQVLELLLSEKKLRSPALGIAVAQQGDRVIVHTVADDGPAARAGLLVGDTLVAIGGTPVTWVPGYALTLRAATAGQPLTLRVLRDGRERDVTLTPLSPKAWAVFSMAGIECGEVPFQQDPEAIRAGWIGVHRKWTKSDGEPPLIDEQAVRIVRLHPRLRDSGLQVGDLLLAAELPKDSAAGTARDLHKFLTTADVQELFQKHDRSTMKAVRFRCWIGRGDRIEVIDIDATPLLW